MKKYHILDSTALFSGISWEQMPGLLDCIGAWERKVAAGRCVIEEGEPVAEFGILLSGRGRVVKTDPAGRVLLITLLTPGSEIGVLLSANTGRKSPVTVQMDEESSILMIQFDRLMTQCARSCSQHERLIRNYVGVVAQKGLMLHERIHCLLQPTVREKMMTYLSRMSAEQGGNKITLPLDRSAMAEYLNVDRSALSRELSKMKKDGLIDYHKNRFQLL